MCIMDTRHKYCVSWIPDKNIMYHGIYQILILCIMDTIHKIILHKMGSSHLLPSNAKYAQIVLNN